jgi:hypothetical protein
MREFMANHKLQGIMLCFISFEKQEIIRLNYLCQIILNVKNDKI